MSIDQSILDQLNNSKKPTLDTSLGALAWPLLKTPTAENLRFFDYLCQNEPNFKEQLLSYLKRQNIPHDAAASLLIKNLQDAGRGGPIFSIDEAIYACYLFYRETQIPANAEFLILSSLCRWRLDLSKINLDFNLIDSFDKNRESISRNYFYKNKAVYWIDLFLDDPKFLDYFKKNKLFFFSLFLFEDEDYLYNVKIEDIKSGVIKSLLDIAYVDFPEYIPSTIFNDLTHLFSISAKIDNLSNLNKNNDNFLHILLNRFSSFLPAQYDNFGSHPIFSFIGSLDEKYYFLLLEKNEKNITPLQVLHKCLDKLSSRVQDAKENSLFISSFRDRLSTNIEKYSIGKNLDKSKLNNKLKI